MKRFVERIASGYLSSNPYHSQIHAADVVQGTYWYIKMGGLRDVVREAVTQLFVRGHHPAGGVVVLLVTPLNLVVRTMRGILDRCTFRLTRCMPCWLLLRFMTSSTRACQTPTSPRQSIGWPSGTTTSRYVPVGPKARGELVDTNPTKSPAPIKRRGAVRSRSPMATLTDQVILHRCSRRTQPRPLTSISILLRRTHSRRAPRTSEPTCAESLSIVLWQLI